MSIETAFIVFTVVLLVGAIPSVVFVALYSVFVRDLTVAGRHMLIFTAVIAGLILDQLATLLVGGWDRHPAHLWVLLGLFVALDLALWHRLYLFFKEQVVFNPPAAWKRRPNLRHRK